MLLHAMANPAIADAIGLHRDHLRSRADSISSVPGTLDFNPAAIQKYAISRYGMIYHYIQVNYGTHMVMRLNAGSSKTTLPIKRA
jgi:hypothetical protein